MLVVPYWCAKGSMVTALGPCMGTPISIDVDTLIAKTEEYDVAGNIDSTTNMRDDKIWIFAGTLDSTVDQG